MTDPDDQVWVTNKGKQTYHSDEECKRIKHANPNGTWTKAEAEAWGKTECAHGAGEVGGRVGDRNYHDLLDEDLDPEDVAPTAHDREVADD